MIVQSCTERFEDIYKSTYHSTLRFIICKCQNINDTNDILQETYLELYKILNKKEIEDMNLEVYVIRIADYKVKKYYSLLQKLRYKQLLSRNESDKEYIDIQDDIDIEELISSKSLCDEIWEFVKDKGGVVSKVFYLRFSEELAIKEIAETLEINESQVKNHLYRVLKEIKMHFRKDEEK